MPAGSPRAGDADGADPAVPVGESGANPARDLGSVLRAAREAAGLSIDDVAARTRIRATVVRTMEAGDFSLCGGHVYARGHLRSIAGVVGTDAPSLLAAYDRMSGQTDTLLRTADGPGDVNPDVQVLRGMGGDRSRPVSTWLIAAVGAAAVLAVIVGISVVHGSGGGSPVTQKPPGHSSGPSTASSPSGAETPTPSQTVAYAGVNVTVDVTGSPSWMNVQDAGGNVVFRGTVRAGTSKEFHSADLLKFVFGYAPAIDLSVNGRKIGPPPIGSGDVATVTIDANTATSGQLG